jgi:hypothetical protein
MFLAALLEGSRPSMKATVTDDPIISPARRHLLWESKKLLEASHPPKTSFNCVENLGTNRLLALKNARPGE